MLPQGGVALLMSLVAVDYILFITADATVDGNPNEVSDTCWVSKSELQAMFEDKSEQTPRLVTSAGLTLR